jgi:hypothetical protein
MIVDAYPENDLILCQAELWPASSLEAFETLSTVKRITVYTVCSLFQVGCVVCLHWRYLRLSYGPEYVTCGRCFQPRVAVL